MSHFDTFVCFSASVYKAASQSLYTYCVGKSFRKVLFDGACGYEATWAGKSASICHGASALILTIVCFGLCFIA